MQKGVNFNKCLINFNQLVLQEEGLGGVDPIKSAIRFLYSDPWYVERWDLERWSKDKINL